MESNEHIMHLITRHLNGEATAAEEAELSAWLEADPANRQELDEYAKLWSDSAEIAAGRSFDTGAAWQKLDTKIRAGTPPVRPKAKVFSLKSLMIAAAVISIVSLSIYFLLQADSGSWQTVSATKGNQQIDLPDGSKVTLRKGGTLRYPEQFTAQERHVKLDGEAFFTVQANAAAPFRVTTTRARVEVLGTQFLVRHTDSAEQVVVKTGKVSFEDLDNADNKVVLLQDQQAILIGNRIVKDTVLNENFMSWESGRLIFDNAPLQQVVADISHLFGVSVKIAPGTESAGPIRIKAEFDNEPLEQVLEELELITGLKISRENGGVLIGK